jgi:hypothetical protein
MGLTCHPCNYGILVVIDNVEVLSDHTLHSLSSDTLLLAFVLLCEAILDAMTCIFLQHSIPVHFIVSCMLEVTAPQFSPQQER